MGVRAAIDVNDGRILTARVEIHRLDHAPVECRLAICSEDGALLKYGLIPTFPGVFSRSLQALLASLRVGHGAGTRHVGFLPSVDEVTPIGRELRRVASATIIEQGPLLSLQVESVDVALQITCFLSDDDGTLRGWTEAYELFHDPLTAGELAEFLALDVHQIQVLEAILPAPIDELAAVPRQECNGVEGLDVLVGTLLAQGAELTTCCGIVGIECRVVLVAVELV